MTTLAIVGPGLIGRSVALAARRAEPGLTVIEIDRGDPLTPLDAADLVVLAAPVEAILSLITTEHARLRHAVTIDTGSTKQAIVQAARAAGLDGFVGGHPMAGGTSRGPEGADATLFDGRRWFLVPHGAHEEAVVQAATFVRALGAVPQLLEDDGSEHDRVMAAVSHLPQVVATTLMAVAAHAAGDRLAWAGRGLADTTRLAASSAEMWSSVLATNAAALTPLLTEMAARLSGLASQLDDPDAVRALFDEGQRGRDALGSAARKHEHI